MTDDVRAALDRFQTFLDNAHSDLIDEKSGFTVGDGMLLVGEVEMSHAHREPDEDPID